MAIPALVEGHLDSVFLPTLLFQIGRADLDLTIRNAGGGSKFWRDAKRYNDAARHQQIIALADLEQHECAPTLIGIELPNKNPGFHLRIAVRMLEGWLIADRRSIAAFLRVNISAVPVAPDAEQHPKRKLVEIAGRSTRRAIREAMIPGDSGATVGPDYVATMSEFVREQWQVSAAQCNSPSLASACMRWAAI